MFPLSSLYWAEMTFSWWVWRAVSVVGPTCCWVVVWIMLCGDIRYIVLKNCGFFQSGDCGEYVVLIVSFVYCTFRRSTSHSISSVVRGLRYIAEECDMTFWKLSVACVAA